MKTSTHHILALDVMQSKNAVAQVFMLSYHSLPVVKAFPSPALLALSTECDDNLPTLILRCFTNSYKANELFLNNIGHHRQPSLSLLTHKHIII